MDSATERKRLDIGSGDVEAIGAVGVDRGIAVGRTQQAKHALALRDFLAAEVRNSSMAPAISDGLAFSNAS